MNETETWWAGPFGASYTDRNRVPFLNRVPFWHGIIAKTGANSAFELGCNFGPNLLALRVIKPGITLRGIDVNEYAISQARNSGMNAEKGTLDTVWYGEFESYDLVFTAGCLIHVQPDALQATMQKLVSLSNRYVLAVEYHSDDEQEVEYRGNHGKLWARPYGKMYQDMGLKLVSSEFLDQDQAFDRCTAVLLEKK